MNYSYNRWDLIVRLTDGAMHRLTSLIHHIMRYNNIEIKVETYLPNKKSDLILLSIYHSYTKFSLSLRFRFHLIFPIITSTMRIRSETRILKEIPKHTTENYISDQCRLC